LIVHSIKSKDIFFYFVEFHR